VLSSSCAFALRHQSVHFPYFNVGWCQCLELHSSVRTFLAAVSTDLLQGLCLLGNRAPGDCGVLRPGVLFVFALMLLAHKRNEPLQKREDKHSHKGSVFGHATTLLHSFMQEKPQRGLSGQKPKHAPFCIKGATTHTSLHQIGPNLASY